VILTGVAGDNCVLFTAADAYMRNLDVAVPADCTVSVDPLANRSALEHMCETLKADTSLSKTIIDKLAA
jgi:nicotinamidase-related amidase